MLNNTLLKVKDIHTFIGPHHILQGVSFSAKPDTITVLIGRNGAGKSTTLKTIIGLLHASKGEIIFGEKNITLKMPYEIARLGIGYVPENMGIFSNLTVEENMKIAIISRKKDYEKRLEKIFEIFKDLKKFWKYRAGNLSGGQKQMLSIARAMINQPTVLLIDEPSKGLAPIIIEKLIAALNEIKKYSTVILVEQNFYMASEVGDYFFIFDDGKVVERGDMQLLVNNKYLKNRYLGIYNGKK
jgi:branched-chain amino acid transport system ATP-binding protein